MNENLKRGLMEAMAALSGRAQADALKALGLVAFKRVANAIGPLGEVAPDDTSKIFVMAHGTEGGLALVAGCLSDKRAAMIKKHPGIDAETAAKWARDKQDEVIDEILTDDAMLFAALMVYAGQTISKDAPMKRSKDRHPVHEARAMFLALRGYGYSDYMTATCPCHECEAIRKAEGIKEL